jgi:hypothetical protein
LFLEVGSGAMVFATALYLLWLASGKPAGGEAYFENYFRHFFLSKIFPDVRNL